MGGLGYGWFLNSSIGRVMTLTLKYLLFERELALLVALQGESSRKGTAGGLEDIHWKDAIRRYSATTRAHGLKPSP